MSPPSPGGDTLEKSRREGFAAQRSAADPAASAWVAANAGSGKTRVLTDRVLRLLLAGADAPSILCLTFTKAAAAEMANRLHQRLSLWTMRPERELRAELRELLGEVPDEAGLRTARRLFASTLEAPGGLRIQTIHAFCESVLKRFPLEAGVPPHFAIADESLSKAMMDRAIDRGLSAAATDPELSTALDLLAARMDENGFAATMRALATSRRLLRRVLRGGGGDRADAGMEAARTALEECLGVARGASRTGLCEAFLRQLPREALAAAAAALAGGSKTDAERGARIGAFLSDGSTEDPAARLAAGWFDIFLTKTGAARAADRMATAKVRNNHPEAHAALLEEQERCLALLDRLRAVAVAETSAALLQFGGEVLANYELEKSKRAMLDYDDLILTVRDLLVAPGRVPWVLFKLDGGIDHVLVDEAQDTSLEQWEIVSALTEEFFAGEGRPHRHLGDRTLFAVGDEKQSIFSFQGAAPAAFHRMRRRLAATAEAGRRPWRDVDLALSFRTVPLLLAAVDAVFAPEAAREGLAEGPVRHAPFRAGAGGCIELWPVVAAAPASAAGEPWDAPLDYVSADSPQALLANRIAGTIRRWRDDGEVLASTGRPIRPGDIMILVRRRDALFQELVAACKAASLPVAGEDRLKLGDSLAVQDLLALARFCLLPEDDLTLATVLRGPFCDLDEDSLMALCLPCQGRSWQGGLWRHLRAVAAERPEWTAAVAMLEGAMARADFVTPHAFFARLLERGGLARLQARLGAQCREPVEELLNLALAFGQANPSSMQGFLAWFEAGGAEIKRDLEQAGDEIRILTVHAAKGLEAPIVFLPDTTAMPDGRFDPAVLWPEGPPPALLWTPPSAEDDQVTAAQRARHRAEQAAEYRRLLYVAMTRARDRLYLCGWERRQRPAGCWYDLVAAGLETLPGGTAFDLPWGEQGQRWQSAQTEAVDDEQPAPGESPQAVAAPPPAWTRVPPPEEPQPPRPLAPSRQAERPPAISPRTPRGRTALARGRLVHLLLQLLPELPAEQRPAAGAALLRQAAPDLAATVHADLLSSVAAILAEPAFAAAFAPGSRAEVALAGRIGATILSGRVDRLSVGEARVLLVEYKTREAPPERPEAVPMRHLRQMACYRALLSEIYPGRPVDCAILWTARPMLMALPAALLDPLSPAAGATA